MKRRPDVLFIATDDMNNAPGCHGHAVVKTPDLDRLAVRGVRFDRAYCQFALCSPPRLSIMTGLAPDSTKVNTLQKHFREAIPDVITLSQCFKNNGYFAARAGRIFHYRNPGGIGTDGLDDPPSWSCKVNPKGIDEAGESKLPNQTPHRKNLGSSIGFHASPAPDEQHTDGLAAAESLPKKYFDLYPPERLEPIPYTEGENKLEPPWAYFTDPPNWNMYRRKMQEALQAYCASI